MTNSVSLNSNIDLTGILKYFSNGYKVDGVIGYNFDIDGLLPRTIQIKNELDVLESFSDVNSYLVLRGKPTSPVADITQDGIVMSAFNNAFAEISKVAAIDFDPNVNSQDSFLYISQVEDISAIAGIGAFPSKGNTGGIVLVDKDAGPHSYETAPDGGSEYDSLAIHEILHNLGLSHPHDSGANTQVYTGPLDADRYTIMSYNHVFGAHDPIPTAREQYGFALNPMPIDIYALQSLYGERAANTGSTSYKWIAAGETRDLDGSDSSISVGRGLYAIWDTAGDDTLDFSAADGFSLVNLVSASMQSTAPAETAAMIAALQNSLYWDDQVEVVKNEITSAASATAGYLSSTIRYEVSSYSYVFNPGGFVIAHNSSPALDREIENAIGGEYADVIIGNHRNNVLTGNGGDDLIYGGSGNDTIDGGLGADEIIGGDGSDTASYSYSSIGVNVNLSFTTGQLSGGDAAGDILRSIENLEGSTKTDVLTGSSTANTINGFDDDDQVFGLDGNDTLLGGQGDDTLVGGKGIDVIDGGDDTDTADYSSARNGNPGMTTGITVDLTLASNQVTNDGFGNTDTMIGIEKVIGTSMADTFTGGATAFEFRGEGGADTLFAGSGVEHFNGGAELDIADYSRSNLGVTAHLDGTAGSGGDAQGDTFSFVEKLIGSAKQDHLYLLNTDWSYAHGGVGDDFLYGGDRMGLNFYNEVQGGAGIDTYYYRGGQSHFGGGGERDKISFSMTGLAENEDGYAFQLSPSIYGRYIERIGQTTQKITIFQVPEFVGSNAKDTFYFTGSARNEMYDGGGGVDTLDLSKMTYIGSGIGINVALNLAQTNALNKIAEIHNIEKFMGSNGTDYFVGGATESWFFGGAGADTMYSGIGIDHFDAGDSVGYNTPFDTARYDNSTSGVDVDLGRSGSQFGGYAQGDILKNVQSVYGSTSGDTLKNAGTLKAGSFLNGLGGDDEIHLNAWFTVADGGADDDKLFAHGSGHTLKGGTGQDEFYFTNSGYATTVTDYELGEDIFISGHTAQGMAIRYGQSYNGVFLQWADGTNYNFRGEATGHSILNDVFFI